MNDNVEVFYFVDMQLQNSSWVLIWDQFGIVFLYDVLMFGSLWTRLGQLNLGELALNYLDCFFVKFIIFKK